MSNKNPTQRSPEHANAALDALLRKGVQADRRATKPPIPTPIPTISARDQQPLTQKIKTPAVASNLERLTVRFTQSEARLLEKARGVARSMGYKISDTTVFRLALNAFQAEHLTGQAIEAILVADGRRRQN
ncbi:MAG: hypothetical protein ABSB42_22625 [Tepidisphaeraceae bacterium]|jgi:hypothetical protein